jgi:hypothetical protein
MPYSAASRVALRALEQPADGLLPMRLKGSPVIIGLDMGNEAPDVQLLGDGDILYPVEQDGGWRVVRVTPGDDEYAAWLRIVQDQDRPPGLFARGMTFWASGVLLYVGIVFGIGVLAMLIARVAHAFT